MAMMVFAADTLIRFKAGRILIHTTSSALRAFESDNPMLVGWLCQFSKPTDVERAIGALQAQDRAGVRSVVDYLTRSGALVEVGSAATNSRNEEETSYRVKQHLRLLARSFYEAACDILSFGPQAEQELLKRTGSGVERRLTALLAATDGLRSELGELRQAYVSAQLAKLNVRPGDRELKLHIGCGKGLLDGWINIDVDPAPLAINVQWGLPFADASARCIYVSHLLEHLYYPKDVEPFLNEIRRVLAPGGIVRIVVPDIEQCIEAYVNNDRSFFGSRRETWPWWPENPTRLEDFLAYAGAGAEPGWLFESHKYGYDFETLSRVLSNAGMCAIKRCGYMASAHAELRVDHVSAVASAKYGDRHYSLFVEAARPEAAQTAQGPSPRQAAG